MPDHCRDCLSGCDALINHAYYCASQVLKPRLILKITLIFNVLLWVQPANLAAGTIVVAASWLPKYPNTAFDYSTKS